MFNKLAPVYIIYIYVYSGMGKILKNEYTWYTCITNIAIVDTHDTYILCI